MEEKELVSLLKLSAAKLRTELIGKQVTVYVNETSYNHAYVEKIENNILYLMDINSVPSATLNIDEITHFYLGHITGEQHRENINPKK